MERELALMVGREDRNVAFLRQRGWSDEKLQVFFVLNSVYQQVLGPLQIAAREGPEGLGGTTAVKHGNTPFDTSTAKKVKQALRDFHILVNELKFQHSWLHANTCSDAIFVISNFERAVSDL